MGVGMIAAGMLFLFNPFVNIVDVLPDFIGYALIIVGLRKLSFLDDRLRDARRGMSILLIFSVIKTMLLPLLSSMDGTMVLLLTFVFFVAESVAAVPAFRNLFGGFTGLGELYGIESTFYRRRRRLSRGEAARRGIDPSSKEAYTVCDGVGNLSTLTVVFILVRGFISFLPELTSLQSPDTVRYEQWSYYNWIFRSAAVLVLLPLAIAWVRSAFRYFHAVSRDGRFIDVTTEKYDREIRPKAGMLCACHMKSVYLLLIAAVITSVNLYVDYVNVLPSIISAAAFAILAVMIRSYLDGQGERKGAVCILVLSALRAVAGISSYIFQSAYAAEYKPEHFLYVSGAHSKYLPVIITSAADGVLGISTVIITVILLRRLYVRQTSYIGELKGAKASAPSRISEAIKNGRLPFVLAAVLSSLSMVLFAAHPILSLYIESWPRIEWIAFIAASASAVYLQDRTSTLLYKDLAEFE